MTSNSQHYELYKYVYDDVIPSHAPQFVSHWRITRKDDHLRITLLVYQNSAFNNTPITDVINTLTILHYTIRKNLTPPASFAPHPVTPETLAYGQPSLATLTTLYTPLLQTIASQLYKPQSTLAKYFTHNDILQEGYLALATLHAHKYYINKRLLSRVIYNNIMMQLRKLPTHYIVNSLDDPVQNTLHDDETLTYADVIPTDEDFVDEIMTRLSDDEEKQKEELIAYIGQRQYDDLLRAYRTHTTSSSTNNRIQALKRHFNKK